MVLSNMAIASTNPWVVSIKRNAAASSFRHINGIAHSAIDGFNINFKNLKFMTMQMHGIRHGGWIGKNHLQLLPLLNPVGISVRIKQVVETPGVVGSRPS